MSDDLDFEDEIEAAPADRTLTDKGNAETFKELNDGRACWCATKPGSGWMVWDRYRWRPDMERMTTAWAMEVGGWWRKQAPAAPPAGSEDPLDKEQADRRKAILKHAARSESAGAVRSLLDLAQPMMAVPGERFDADDMLLCTPSHYYNLGDWKRSTPRPEKYSTRATSVDAGGDCPQWLAFLDRIMGGDQEMVTYLQKALGYCLTGSNAENCIFIAYGSGANGKSTFMDTIMHVFGEYALATRVETFMAQQQGSIPNAIAALDGARLVSCSETPEGGGLDEALVKQVSGGDLISARFLNREYFNFKPKFKLWMLTNHKPVIKGTDNGIWRRIRLIPFEVTIPLEQRDTGLTEKLKAEAGGILRWALAGLRLWREQGLKSPERIEAATEGYRSEMDILGEFLRDECEIGPSAFVSNTTLYSRYVEWAKANGLIPKSHKWLSRALMDKQYTQENGRAGRCWRGLTVRDRMA